MREAIEKRVSRRNFTGEQLGASQVETIQKMVAAANEKSGLSIEFVEDGSIAFSNVRTTYGIFSKVQPMPDWIKSGMEAVIAAPSAMNKQKPHFAYSEGILTATVPNDYRADLTDLGIAKLHFEIGANNGGHFEFGNGKPYLM